MVFTLSIASVLLLLASSATAQSPEWGQCGGIGWKGATTCVAGTTCVASNPYYSQCLPGTASTTTSSKTTTVVTTSVQTTSKAPPTSTTTTTSLVTTTSSSAAVTTTPSKAGPGLSGLNWGSVYYGSCVEANTLTSDATYKALLSNNIDCTTAENECKMDATEPTQGQFTFTACDAVQAFTASIGAKFRLHNTVWYSQLPAWWSSLATTAVQAAMQNHIQTVIGHYKGKSYSIDVVNEAFNDDGTYRTSPFYNAMGTSFIPLAFTYARAADPAAKLYYNDYNLEYAGAKQNSAFTLVSSLVSQSLIDGVGFQGHFIVDQVQSQGLPTTLARFSALGVDVALTELDIRMPTPATAANLAQQSSDYAYTKKACLANSRCVGITTWGITDKYSWVPSSFSGQGAALPYDTSFAPKPAYTALAS